MAAIKPHLAMEGENTPLQNEYWRCSGGGALGGLGDGEACPAPEVIANEAHAELMNVAWIRQALIQKMEDRKIWIEYGNDGTPAIAIDKPVGGAAWNPSSGAKQTTILGWTTKMGAPSFSLPAGAPDMGGSCPGATAGQSVVSLQKRQSASRLVLRVLNEHKGKRGEDIESVRITKAICEFCYAEGGQYATSGVQNAQLMRFAWARKAINRDGHQDNVSEFYSVMLDAIDSADFVQHEEPAHFGTQRFFRLHDSGDFFGDGKYFKEWKKITLFFHHKVGGEGLTFNADGSFKPGAGHPRPIWFWAPTRMWAVGEGRVDLFAKWNAQYGDNFMVRPSAYHINERGPVFAGWAAPSTVYDHASKPEGVRSGAFQWDCQAYAAAKGPSCRGAKNPDGLRGCRACWLHGESAVNYTLHL